MTTVNKSIVIPCYNERDNLPSLIRSFDGLRSADSDWELVLVNNGSSDGSDVYLDEALAQQGRSYIRVVTVPAPNIGYGHGMMQGLRAARGQWLAWTHADGQVKPSEVLEAFRLLASSPEPRRTLVKGRRRGRSARDAFFTIGLQLAARVILSKHLPDISGFPKAFPRELLELATAPPIDLSLDLYFYWLARTHQFDVVDFDVRILPREHGESKWAFSWKSKTRTIARFVGFMGRLRTGADYDRA